MAMRRGSSRIRAGFSMPELMMAMFLIAIITGLGLTTLRHASNDASSHALALELTAQLRLAQTRAIATQTPVAVAIPSSGGTLALSQSVYLAQGMSVAQPYRTLDYSHTYPTPVIFVGYWPLVPGLSNSVTPPLSKARLLNLNNWLPATMKQDYCLVFTPDGGVASNGLSHFGGAYHLVVADGVNCAPSASPTGVAPVSTLPGYFSPQAMGKCWTITVNINGAISLESGLGSQDGSIPIAGTMASSSAFAPSPSLPAPSASAPVVNAITLEPKADPAALPANTSLLVAPGGHVSITTTASDPGGHEIYLNWTCSSGVFSNPGEVRMTWDEAAQRWTSTWQWQCPPNAVPDTRYTLTCSLRNSLNALATIPSSQFPQIQVAQPGKIVFAHAPLGGIYWDDAIYMETAQGAGLREVLPRGNWLNEPDFKISPDGTKLAYCAHVFDRTYITDLKGQQLLALGQYSYCPSWNPTGTKLAYWQLVGGVFQLRVANADGSNPVVLHNTAGNFRLNTPMWSPDGNYLSFASYTTHVFSAFSWTANDISKILGGSAQVGSGPFLEWDLHTCKASDGSQMVDLIAPAFESCWDPHPSTYANAWVYYANGKPAFGSGDGNIWKVHPDGTGHTQVTNFAGAYQAQDVFACPEGDALLFTADQAGVNQVFKFHLTTNSITQMTTGSGGRPSCAP